jgi:hypothetical protein
MEFILSDTKPGVYLHHNSDVGDFDRAVTPLFRRLESRRVLRKCSRRLRSNWRRSSRLSYTIGGMMLFPGNQRNGKMTINQARGFHPRVKDRFDFTVEYIRRHYVAEPSPLLEVFAR